MVGGGYCCQTDERGNGDEYWIWAGEGAGNYYASSWKRYGLGTGMAAGGLGGGEL